MKKAILITIASLALGAGAKAYDYTDDIYYNPKKSESKKTSQQKGGQYIVDFSTMDVDEYNRRGQYYYSPVDTIGTYIENEPDFVYTTQIQKYYNPTIVTDNADVIQDVLNNSYGNVEIVYNYNGAPSIVPWTTYYSWPYYSYSWYSPWSWSFNIGPFGWSVGWNNWWGWSPGWNWGWNWGPSWNWAWSPGWGPGWGGPGWGWGPGWGGPGWGRPHPPRPMATYSPGGRAPFGGPHGNIAHNNTHVGNFNGGGGHGNMGGNQPPRRPQTPTIQHGNNVGGTASRPTFTTSGRRPATGVENAQVGSGNVSPSGGRPSVGTTERPTFNSSVLPAATTTINPSGATTTMRPSEGTTTTRPSGTTTTTRPSGPATNMQPSTTTTRPTTTTTKPSNTTTTKPSNTTTTRPSNTTNAKPSNTTTTRPTTTNRQPSTSRPSTSSPTRSGSMGGGSRGGFGGGGGRSGGGGGGGRGGRR